MSKLSIKMSAVLIVAINIFALLCIATTYFFLSKASDDLATALSNKQTSFLLADELRQSSDDLTRLARTYVVTGDPSYEDQYNAIIDIRAGKKNRPQDYFRIYWDFVAADGKAPRPDTNEKIALLDIMKKAGFTDEEFAKLDEAANNSDTLVQTEVRAMNLVKGIYPDANGKYTVHGAPDVATARELMHSKAYHREKAKIMKPVDEFYVMMENRLDKAIADTAKRTASYEKLFVGALVILLFSVVLTTYLIMRRILKPMTVIRKDMSLLAQGQNDIVVSYGSNKDEIGEMSRALDYLRQQSIVAQEAQQREMDAQQGRLQRFERVDGLISSFDQSIQSVVDQVSKVAANMNQSSSQLADMANDTSHRITTMLAATEEASVSVQSIAKSTEALSSSFEDMSSKASESSKVSNLAAEQGNAVTGMISSLVDSSEKVGEVVSIISEIAAQTNLLALNATIEAARAGDAGKGFAVVANEVKALADQTARATEEIQKQIGNIQTKVNEASTVIAQTTQTIIQVDSITAVMSDVIRDQSLSTREISGAVGEAAIGTKEISNNMISVKNVADNTQESAGQLKRAAQVLANENDKMKSMVSDFLRKIKEA